MDAFTVSYVALWVIVCLQGLVILFLVRQLGAVFLGTRGAIERDGIRVGRPMPPIEGRDAAGNLVRPLASIDRWMVLIYTAPTCGICRELLPSLDGLIRRLGPNARFMVLLEASWEVAAEYMAATRTTANVVAVDQQTAKQMAARVSPFVHVVDVLGVVRAKGLVNEVAHIEQLLATAGVTDVSLPQHAEHHHEALRHANG